MFAPDPRVAGQRGLAQIELMVGLAVGLIVVAAALAATATLLQAVAMGRDSADLQQRADTALRLIGRQVRQAGSRRLLADGAGVRFSTAFEGWNRSGRALTGIEGGPHKPDTLCVSYEPDSLDDRDALGYRPNKEKSSKEKDRYGMDPGKGDVYLDGFDSQLFIDTDVSDQARPALYARGARPRYDRQSLVSGIDDMQLQYGVRDTDGRVRYVDADSLLPDAVVLALSVCLQLSSEGRHGVESAVDCNGLPLAPRQQQGRLVRLVRAVFKANNAG